MTNWNITSIENITYVEAQKNALETMQIKDHDCFFVDFGGKIEKTSKGDIKNGRSRYRFRTSWD